MRSFIVTLILFALMLAGIAGNAIFLHRLCDDMLAILDTLPESPDKAADAVNALLAQWKNARSWLSLSVSNPELTRVQDALAALRAHSCGDSKADYTLAREQLRLAIEAVLQFERLAWDNIL